jgi:hypothetical protein
MVHRRGRREAACGGLTLSCVYEGRSDPTDYKINKGGSGVKTNALIVRLSAHNESTLRNILKTLINGNSLAP